MLSSIVAAIMAMGVLGCAPANQGDDLDIARGIPAQFSVTPNYPGCTDPNDPNELTDGVLASGNEWSDPAAVGWYHTPQVEITFDLQNPAAIGAVELHTAATVSVPWPKLIIARGSDDGQSWHDLGELIGDQEGEAKAYETRWYRLKLGATRLRFVRIVATSGGASQTFFTDEVRILRATGGQPKALTSLPAQVEGGTQTFQVARAVRMRILKEVDAARELVQSNSSSDQGDLLRQLDQIAADARQAGTSLAQPVDKAAMLGQNDLDLQIAKIRAKGWRDGGLSGVVVWKKHRYAFGSPADTPPSPKPDAAVRVDSLRGEVRGDALMLTNTTDTDQAVSVQVSGLDGADTKVAVIPWVDTPTGVLASSALRWSDSGTLPAGTTTRLWLRVDTSGMSAGSHAGSVTISTGGNDVIVPITVNVSRVQSTRPRMALTVSDYAVGNAVFDLKPPQVEAIRSLLREAYVNTVWARRGVLPWPSESDFDADNHLKGPLDFGAFDRWLSETSDMRYHIVFLNAPDSFAGAKEGTDAFAARVAEWANAVQSHVPASMAGRVGFLTVDEPRSEEQGERSIRWAKALKTGAPKMVLFTDPQWENPGESAAQKVIEDADVVILHVGRVVGKGNARAAYQSAVRSGGQTWIYGTNRGGKALSPSAYYRLMPWRAFAEGATGVSLWSIVDDGRAISSWDEYTATSPVFTPIYLGDTVVDSVHWQALAEGMEDVELFTRLRAATRGTSLQRSADRLLAKVSDLAVVPESQLSWPDAPSPQPMDDLRIQAIALLEKAKG